MAANQITVRFLDGIESVWNEVKMYENEKNGIYRDLEQEILFGTSA